MKKTIITLCILLLPLLSSAQRQFLPYTPEINEALYSKLLMKHESEYSANTKAIQNKLDDVKEAIEDLYEYNRSEASYYTQSLNDMLDKWNKNRLDYADDRVYSSCMNSLNYYRRQINKSIRNSSTK